jgi:hypothetical protein
MFAPEAIMKIRSLAAAFVVFCAALTASAGTITSITPTSVKVNSGEYFLTVYGTSLGTTLLFDGPTGRYSRAVSAVFNDRVVGWVPEEVVATSGTWKVYVMGDPSGDSGPATFNVVGFTFPLVLLMPEYLRVQPRDRTGAGVKYDVMAIGGNDPNPVVNCDPANGSWFPMGITRVKCSASNIYGERADGVFDVIVRDEVAPVLSLPLDPISVKATTIEGAVVDYKVTANDAIYGEVIPDCLPKAGSLFPIGVTNVLCTATDNDLNVGNASFAVEVYSDVKWYPLRVSLPADIHVDAVSPKGTDVKFDVTVSGTRDLKPRITCDHNSGDTFPIGVTSVTCDALDYNGMRGSASFSIYVADVGLPQILELYTKPDTLIADGRLYPIDVFVTVTDDVDLQPVCEIFDVTSKEDITLDDGDDPKDYDWLVTAPLALELRAERQTTQRVYNVWVACTDYWGNSTRSRTTVTVTGGTASQLSGPGTGKRRAAR